MSNEKLYKKVEKDGGVCFVAVEAEKEIVKPLEKGYKVWDDGLVSAVMAVDEGNFNAFPTRESAQAHSKRQRVFNAMGQACALVDPDGDCGNFGVFQSESGVWFADDYGVSDPYLPRVSTREAAEKVCEVLTEWGV